MIPSFKSRIRQTTKIAGDFVFPHAWLFNLSCGDNCMVETLLVEIQHDPRPGDEPAVLVFSDVRHDG